MSTVSGFWLDEREQMTGYVHQSQIIIKISYHSLGLLRKFLQGRDTYYDADIWCLILGQVTVMPGMHN